jgi:hypothetical protein
MYAKISNEDNQITDELSAEKPLHLILEKRQEEWTFNR